MKKEIGHKSLNIFDESYIDWIKPEKEPKTELDADIIQESQMEDDKTTVSENVIVPQVSASGSLTDHSPNCQLRRALEDTIGNYITKEVLTCCAQNPALQVAKATNSQLHVATNVVDSAGLAVPTDLYLQMLVLVGRQIDLIYMLQQTSRMHYMWQQKIHQHPQTLLPLLN